MKKIVSNLKKFVKFGTLEIKPFDNIVSDEDYKELTKNKIFNHYVKTEDFKVSDIELEEDEETSNDYEDFKTLSIDELKEKYSIEDLKAICKSFNMRNYSELKEDELIAKITSKVNG